MEEIQSRRQKGRNMRKEGDKKRHEMTLMTGERRESRQRKGEI